MRCSGLCGFGHACRSRSASALVYEQEKGRLEVKVAALGEENRKLQQVILQLERQRKEVESQNVSTNNRAAKVGLIHTCTAMPVVVTSFGSISFCAPVRGGHHLPAAGAGASEGRTGERPGQDQPAGSRTGCGLA